jgi:hypothetical protein
LSFALQSLGGASPGDASAWRRNALWQSADADGGGGRGSFAALSPASAASPAPPGAGVRRSMHGAYGAGDSPAGGASLAPDARCAALCAAAAAWRAACDEAATSAPLSRLLDVAAALAGILGGGGDGDDDGDSAAQPPPRSRLAAAAALLAQPALVDVLARTLGDDGGDDGGDAGAARAATQLPHLAAAAAGGADGAALAAALARLRDGSGNDVSGALARATQAVAAARSASRALCAALGEPAPMAGSEPLAAAGAALRTLHAFTAALDAAATRADTQ